jgi:hypothetical protein
VTAAFGLCSSRGQQCKKSCNLCEPEKSASPSLRGGGV